MSADQYVTGFVAFVGAKLIQRRPQRAGGAPGRPDRPTGKPERIFPNRHLTDKTAAWHVGKAALTSWHCAQVCSAIPHRIGHG
jgi:hypothetical protein